MIRENSDNGGKKVVVVAFADAERPRWLRLLAKGFRHCFALVAASGRWIVIDPMSHWTEVVWLADEDDASPEDVVRALEERGLAAVACVVIEPEKRGTGPAPYTCVEVVKRVLGVRAPQVLTPRQLFRFLDQNHIKMKKILDKGVSV